MVRLTAERIRRMEVRGATQVARAALKAVQKLARETKARSKREFLKELIQAKRILFKARPTEPLMRNSLRYLIDVVERSDLVKVKELASLVSLLSNEFLENMERSQERIASIGSKRVVEGDRILTHCHSTTVIEIFKRARSEEKNFEVICTETRPLFQGRRTARELLDMGIRVRMIIDSAIRFFLREVDFVLVGCDVITSEGNIINKIGTSLIALAAKEARVPFYVASELLKFDPETICGEYTEIEERDGEEIWKNAPPRLEIKNPSFDVTRREFIHGIICEEGVIPPHSINEVVGRKYPWIFRLG
jgi:ribose 1,5-bisphosphate isomerase